MKKLNIFLLGLLSIVLVVLLMPNAYASGLSAQYPLDLTIVYGEGPTDVHKPNLGPFNHGQNTGLDLNALNGTGLVGNKSFAFYVVDGQIVESADYQFKVTSNTKVTSVFTDGAEHAAVFVDSNGEFIAVDYVDGVTAPVAPNVATLSKPGYTPVAYGVLDPISEHTVYVVEYELTNSNAAVTINGVEYPYDSIVTLESTDENFTHWESNGVIVSYNPVYKFSALYDRTVEAKTSVVTETTIVTLTDDLGFRSSEGKSSYLGQFDLKDGEVLIEAGIIGSEVYVNDLKLDTLGATIIPSSVINPTTGEFLRTVDSDLFELVRGYVVTSAGTYYSVNATPQENTGLMIYEVYGGGGNTGAIYTNDYVVLYNGTSFNIDLSSYSLQYASASKSFTNINSLTGTIKAGSYYVARLGGGSAGSPLPRVDFTGLLNLSSTDGKVALALGDDGITGPTDKNVVDFVGFGSANAHEGSNPIAALSNSTSGKRNSFIDTNDNANNFTVGTPDLTYTLDGEFYTVSFATNQGSTIDEVEVFENNKVNKPTPPTRSGYIFDQWYADSDRTIPFDFNTLINADITLYAGWFFERTVTFLDGAQTLSTSKVKDGDKVLRPSNPLKPGFSFVDWFVDAEFITVFDFDTLINEDKTIYAKFEEDETVEEPELPQYLLFSEYIEGSSNNKAYELFNGTGIEVDLSKYRVKLYANANQTSSVIQSFTGTLLNMGTLAVVHNQAVIPLKDAGKTADIYVENGTTTAFNGDDRLELQFNNNGTWITVDSIGQNNGSTSPGNFGIDKTYTRKANIVNGDINMADAWTWAEWNVYNVDTFTHLGSHTFSPE